MHTLPRPKPLTTRATPIDRRVLPPDAVRRMQRGEALEVTDRYATARVVWEALVADGPDLADDAGHGPRRERRDRLEALAPRLRVPVVRGAIALAGAPELPMLAELYPDLERFALPYATVRRLVEAQRVRSEGVHLPVLGSRLHPRWSVFVPRRTEHLELFAQWLRAYEGPKARAVDVGTGSGVLALLMARAGVEAIEATDLNPHAVASVADEVARRDPPPPIRATEADLIPEGAGPYDLVVFNPPWTHGPVATALDAARLFDDALFPRFFAAADAALVPGGRVVLVFSDLIRWVQPDVPHPIEAELAKGRWQAVQVLRRKAKGSTTRSGQARRTKERLEVWEIARVGEA